MKIFYWLSIAFIACFVSGCTLFSPVQSESQNKYVLKTLPPAHIKKTRQQITLLVSTPYARSFYDTRLMAYSRQPYQISYFAKSTWLSTPAEMLQPLIVQSLQNTQYFHAVISPSVGAETQYNLNTQIEELLQDYTHGRPVFRLMIRAEIVRLSSNRVVATKQFVVTQPIMQISPYAGVLAANQATANMLQQLTQFCLKTI